MKTYSKAVILIVDDKPANIFALESLLAAKDRVLLTSTNGEDALKLTFNKNVDLIILDVQMPGMDGFEVAQILKSNKRTKDIPIIFATAENKEHKFVMQGYDEGAVDYLFKPLDPLIVKAKVEVLLQIQLQKKELVEKNISLQKSELLINNSADIIGIIDAVTFQVDEINNAFTHILGYSQQETKGTTLTFFLSNEDRVLVQELAMQGKERLSFETRIYCKDRTIKWLQWKVVVKDGKWYINARDITEIKEVEKIRNYLAAVVKQSNDAIYIHDHDGNIISWNEGAEKMYGYSEKAALKMKVWNIIPSFLQPETETLTNKIIAGEKIEGLETKRITKHGKLLDVLFSASVIADMGAEKVSIAITEKDITEQKIADELVKESETRFRKLFENAPCAMWVYDMVTLKFLEVNHTAVVLYGYSREEFLSMRITDIRPEDEIPKLMKRLADLSAPSSTGTWIHRLRNGQLIHVEITSDPIDFKGQKALLVMANNVSERKKAEQQIRQLNTELQINIHQLETTNKEIESFSYSISHDLRAPLRAINGYSRIIGEDYSEALDEEGNRLLTNIQSNVRNMGLLIDDLLAFSRLGRKEVQKTSVQNTAMVNSIVNEIQGQGHCSALIKIGDLPVSYADHSLLRQVWINLISNAIKYSCKKESPVIEIGSINAEGEITYYVKDNGAGFNMEYANKLFGVFQRLHSPNEFEGTGIGLAIVQRIIVKHGGRVWAEGVVDKGATFYFTLPKLVVHQEVVMNEDPVH
ncbi:MAG: PAS domain S-box protein [Ferruginibacter sp.]